MCNKKSLYSIRFKYDHQLSRGNHICYGIYFDIKCVYISINWSYTTADPFNRKI